MRKVLITLMLLASSTFGFAWDPPNINRYKPQSGGVEEVVVCQTDEGTEVYVYGSPVFTLRAIHSGAASAKGFVTPPPRCRASRFLGRPQKFVLPGHKYSELVRITTTQGSVNLAIPRSKYGAASTR